MYKERFYRKQNPGSELLSYEVRFFESDLLIKTDSDLSLVARKSTEHYHGIIREYIRSNPEFGAALKPIPADTKAPLIIKKMIAASRRARVGPMAAVAGAMAEFVGKDLLKKCSEVIVENGGDIFLKVHKIRKIGIFAGAASVFNGLALLVRPEETPCGICTSSGRIGHSLSFGLSDAVMVRAASALTADAYATAIANLIKNKKDLPRAVETAKKNPLIQGVVAISGDEMISYGNVELEILDKKPDG